MKKREAELEFSKHKVQRDAKSPWVLNKRCTLTMAAWQTNSNKMPATISQNVKNFLENHVVRRQIMHATTCEKLQFAFVKDI